ncbi:MAG TPA: Maf family protein, partial [Steroidobacteraceae bacterium]|nr:Maf family protein [Steroidobacteraceae bacterium]
MPPAAPLVCLASVSPRRHELLAQIGVAHVVSAADIDEAVHPGEPAAQYVVRIACAKARVVRARGMALPVLAADTTVVIDGTILAKPRD